MVSGYHQKMQQALGEHFDMCIRYAQGCALCVGDFEAFKGLFIREYSGIFEKKVVFLNILTSSIVWKHPKNDISTRSKPRKIVGIQPKYGVGLYHRVGRQNCRLPFRLLSRTPFCTLTCTLEWIWH